ncbi:MAG: hypothetical protein H8D56_09430 [Planctomycetes bacterium]|nr:hypothetical protein [Planctomycetota bacterium]MBL7146315.1 hypothetical protein [Phycisphaerae bacterium]
MKKLIAMVIPVLVLFAGAFTQSSDEAFAQPTQNTTTNVNTNVDTNQNQSVSVIGGGDSDSSSKSSSDSKSSIISTSTSISNYKTRTPPITTFPPYLPYWNHGGWGTIKAYFPNGPNTDDQVYERVFDPQNPNDQRELRGVLESLPYENPLNIFGGILNGVGAVFGGPDNYHHGRGFEIASSLVRTRRPGGKPLLVFIDSNVDTKLLKETGYTYVGKVSLEGKVDRNWDHVYDAAVAEALPWDVDILLISGGMKGVTVGSNTSFPGAGGAYSQTNYSVSMFGSVASGITEGKGKALVSAAGYRYCPAAANRRRIPQAFYNRIQAMVKPAQQPEVVVRQVPPAQKTEIYVDVPEETPSVAIQEQYPEIDEEPLTVVLEEVPPALTKEKRTAVPKMKRPGVKVSRELLEMAGFPEHQYIYNLTIK